MTVLGHRVTSVDLPQARSRPVAATGLAVAVGPVIGAGVLTAVTLPPGGRHQIGSLDPGRARP